MKTQFRFPRLKVKGKVRLTEELLRHCYNDLMFRRNPHFGKFYDVYRVKKFPTAKIKFTLLAMTLLKYKINPKTYLTVLCGYGKFKSARYLPSPVWLASSPALDTFNWMVKTQQKRYGSLKDMQRALGGGIEIRRDEILEAIRISRQVVEGQPEPFLFAMRDAISVWYFAAIFDKLVTYSFFSMFEKTRIERIKQCLLFYSQHPRILKLVRGELYGNV